MKISLAFIVGFSLVVCGRVLAEEHGGKGHGAAKAAGDGQAKADRPAPVLVDMTVTGKVSKVENNEHAGKRWGSRLEYMLTDDQGKEIGLAIRRGKPGQDAAKDAAPVINLADYVGRTVVVTGRGFEAARDGKKTTRIVRITKIDEVTQAPAVKPAQP